MLNLVQKFCLRCFKPMWNDDPTCPYCGASCHSNYVRYSDMLRPFSLVGRYLIGHSYSDTENECTYYACDVLTRRPVLLTVYFPYKIMEKPNDEYGMKCTDIRVVEGKEAEYADGKRSFTEKYSHFLMPDSPAVYGIEQIFRHENVTAAVGKWPPVQEEEWKTVPKFRRVYEAFMPLMEYAETLSIPLSSFAAFGREFTDFLRLDDGIIKFVPAYCCSYRFSEMDEGYFRFYMAPECIKGKVCPASDVYNICMSMYYIMTGKLCNTADRMLTLTSNESEADPLVPPSKLGVIISEKEEEVLMKGLDIHYKNRWQSVAEMKRAFAEAEAR